MHNGHTPKLTSSELAMLWSTYMNDTLAVCVLEHLLTTVEDPEVPKLLNEALTEAKEHITSIEELFNQENIPVPQGFTESDVHKGAPRLFSDEFYLRYLRQMGRAGMATYSLATGTSVREDVLTWFNQWLQNSSSLYKKTTNMMVKKGIIVRSPTVPYPSEVEFVHNKHFSAAFFRDQRPLLSMEIAHLGTNIEINNNVQTLLLGFAQVAKSKKVRKYMERGHEIAAKQKNVFFSTLDANNSPTPGTWDANLSASTTAPFSDKLMMFHVGALIGMSMGNYGTAMGASMRRDLAADYARLMAEIAQFAEDGVELMIENGWMEKPPQTLNRHKLINQPKK